MASEHDDKPKPRRCELCGTTKPERRVRYDRVLNKKVCDECWANTPVPPRFRERPC